MPMLNKGSLITSDDSAELLDNLPFLLTPIRELFAKTEQGLSEMLQDIAVLDSRFQHDMIRGNDWTRLLLGGFSFRKGLSQNDLVRFAASATENDMVHFNRLCSTGFRTMPGNCLGSIDERLLIFSDDVRACITADADLVKSTAEPTMVR
jgi:hypothetical protein